MAFLANLKERLFGPSEASKVETVKKPGKRSVMGALAMTLCFAAVFGLAMVQPAAAVTINLSVITDVINAFIGILEPITNLIIAIVPLWFVLQILAFIMGLLTAVLAMIKFNTH
jgi:hypothetical protein